MAFAVNQELPITCHPAFCRVSEKRILTRVLSSTNIFVNRRRQHRENANYPRALPLFFAERTACSTINEKVRQGSLLSSRPPPLSDLEGSERARKQMKTAHGAKRILKISSKRDSYPNGLATPSLLSV